MKALERRERERGKEKHANLFLRLSFFISTEKIPDIKAVGDSRENDRHIIFSCVGGGKRNHFSFVSIPIVGRAREKENFETYCLDYFVVLLVTLNRDTIGSEQIRTIVPHRTEKLAQDTR